MGVIPTAQSTSAPAQTCFLLASRLIPDLDGGFAHAVMRRAQDLQASGFDVTVLTFDPAPTVEHDEHRAEWGRRGDRVPMRNLFDDARSDSSWLIAAATGTTVPADVEYRDVTDAEGRVMLSLPVVISPRWHMTDAPVLVYDDERVVGSVAGFAGLYAAWLDTLVPDDGVVIVEARQLGEQLVGWHSPATLIHTIHTSHVEPPYTADAPVNALWQSWFAIADRFDAVVWPTSTQLQDVVQRFGARRDVVIPNGVSAAAPGTGAREDARAIMVNRLAPGKRVDHALRAWALVVADVPHARMDIYGDGAERERLEALRDELGLTAAVTFHGHVANEDVPYGTASMLVLTTAYEGQSLVVAEALASGLPVVSYDVNYGPREVLSAGGGVLVPSGDVPALATALVGLLQDAPLRARLSSEAVEVAVPLSHEVVAAQWATLIRTLTPPRLR